MPLPVNKRDFDVFLSYSHKDHLFVRQLYQWLTGKAGLKVWHDETELPAGSMLATDLGNAIGRCRSVLLVASEESLQKGWVAAEYNCAMDERANVEGFRVVALRIGDADVRNLMKGLTWIDAAAPSLDAGLALALMAALYPGAKMPSASAARDVYVSCSWHAADRASAGAVCKELVAQGLRLVGDAKDQQGFSGGDRVERIIASCGAFVGIVPYRGDQSEACADADPYKYFMREMDIAAKLGLPSIVVADPRVARSDGADGHWLRMETQATRCPDGVASALGDLWDDWKTPPKPQYVFWALDLDSQAAAAGGKVRHLIEQITGMPTVVGNEIQGESLHLSIMNTVCNAFLVVADITDDNVNTCIEAGMALAAGTNVRLIARGKSRNPPFMLRAAGQLAGYVDEADQVGVLHRALRPFRRRIVNSEL